MTLAASGRAGSASGPRPPGFGILVDMRAATLILAAGVLGLAAAPTARGADYGDKGIYPVYALGSQWVIFDKAAKSGRRRKDLRPGNRLLIVGTKGAAPFDVRGSSKTYGGACQGHIPVPLRAALLEGPRPTVGEPVMAIRLPRGFRFQGSRARYAELSNRVGEDLYQRWLPGLRDKLREELASGGLRLRLEDDPGEAGRRERLDELAAGMAVKIDAAFRVEIAGLSDAWAFVEGVQILGTYRRCVRLADGNRLIGECAPMPHDLMAETSRLGFLSYDPSGRGRPLLLARTREQPLWGHERWGFALKPSGPEAVLADAMDVRCREAF